jgi:hypothetical protein
MDAFHSSVWSSCGHAPPLVGFSCFSLCSFPLLVMLVACDARCRFLPACSPLPPGVSRLAAHSSLLGYTLHYSPWHVRCLSRFQDLSLSAKSSGRQVPHARSLALMDTGTDTSLFCACAPSLSFFLFFSFFGSPVSPSALSLSRASYGARQDMPRTHASPFCLPVLIIPSAALL